jgi:hypothetical protein
LALSAIKEHHYLSNAAGTMLTSLPASCMSHPPDSAQPHILTSDIITTRSSKLSAAEPQQFNDENDKNALNRMDKNIPQAWASNNSAADYVKQATKVIAEVNTNRSFRLRTNGTEANGSEKSNVSKPTRSSSAAPVRPETQSITNSATQMQGGLKLQSRFVKPKPDIKSSYQKFDIYSDGLLDSNDVPVSTQSRALSNQAPLTSSNLNNRKETVPPPLPYEKEKRNILTTNLKQEKRGPAPLPVNNALVAPEEFTIKTDASAKVPIKTSVAADDSDFDDINEEVGLDKLEWNLGKMNFQDKSSNRQSTESNMNGENDFIINEVMRDDKKDVSEAPSNKNSSGKMAAHTTPVGLGTKPTRTLRTLEAIHDTLSQSFGADTAKFEAGSSAAPSDVWVVRYMDYTSKYGLGFLLNNGCTGVYFNDSTKIILSSDGMVFQYFERRRKGSSSCTSEGDHMKTTYLIASHPQELVKKVTLLRHFRDYLLDRRTPDSQIVPEGKGNLVPVHPVTLPENNPESTIWTLSSRGNDLDLWNDMPYLKKWVRTRHAVLFRLSNRSVQVSFFDMR